MTTNAMDYKTFKTRTEATKALRRLVGWPNAKVDCIYLPDDANADRFGYVHVLRCTDQGYMRSNGFVR